MEIKREMNINNNLPSQSTGNGNINMNPNTALNSTTNITNTSGKLAPWNAEMSEFFTLLDKYHPTIPDSVVQYHLSKSGVNIKDPRITRLVALATDKFLAEIIFETKQLSTMKKRKGKDKRKIDEISECIQLSDLSQVLQTKRIGITRKFKENDES